MKAHYIIESVLLCKDGDELAAKASNQKIVCETKASWDDSYNVH
jgi:hypothetical protein